MLLLGFEAPLEQVLYLDQIMKDHHLLEAIARVNRIYPYKNGGTFIDYVGVTNHFKEAMLSFDYRDLDDVLESFKTTAFDIDQLRFCNERIHEFFKDLQILYLEDTEKCVDALSDGKSRNAFLALFRNFLTYMDKVLPKAEAQQYIEELKLMTLLCYTARIRYRDEFMLIQDLSPKLRVIIDEFFGVRGIDPKAPPALLFSKPFDARLNSIGVSKSKASEMEYALREYFLEHHNEDPEFYTRYSDKLEQAIADYKDKPDTLKTTLQILLEDVRKGRNGEENIGLDPIVEKPLFSLLMYHIFDSHDYKQLTDNQFQLLLELLRKMIPALKKEIQQPNFWTNLSAQRKLKAVLIGQLITISMKKEKSKKSTTAIAQAILEFAYCRGSDLNF
jgi:type I restriction enzyme, R subunit